ncbi:hypothetical protein D8674_038803 [Pyrus ussuriensis x Pyrus communis]|uniref:Uncharacterized protein n=1 Tax=Pyrus ussuriensis x Pyrus communis TaxID=2448454 RepID=A0A5N5HBH9_9ROSA|nr:hypothetical protein D8674_006853 [Pyrus ussuriensis x Pyrus communis]KAB2623511.1 hypothetical protein D8674_038803 [Pyrus ussuriensis x Pyrus communis]
MDKDYKNACWRHHGEQNIGEQNVGIGEEETGDEVIGMHDFLNDVFVQPLTEEGVGPSTEPPIGEGRPEEVQTFFKLLEEADQDLWPGCKEFKKLEAVVRLYQIKCLAGMPDEIFTTLLELIKRMLPEGDCLPESCYKAKKLINDLGLSYVKIDACPNDCMIYWKDTSDLTVCSVCGKSRYKITNAEDSSRKKVAAKVMWYFPLKPRLQRFFMSKHMAEHMRWHATECPKDEFMRHPSDSPAWKHLDNLYPDFASEIRNVRLGLASDGFNPFGKMRNDHSTWPVVLSVYNLPPWMCMKQPNLLLSLLIPGPRSPGKEIDVYMRPLIDELNELWEVGIPTYDAFSNQSFTMKAAVLWTISDFPAYGMLSGWSTHGYKACPHFHLADEAALAGPVQYRWMYPIERYLQTLKRYVRNKGRPEGSIAEAYLVDECLSFCSMYLRDVESRRTRRGRNEDGIGRGVSGGLSIFDSKGCYMGSGENVELNLNVLDQCHRYILNNCDEVSPFRRQHEEFLKTKYRRERLTMRQIKELSKKEFPEWFKQHSNLQTLIESGQDDNEDLRTQVYVDTMGPERYNRVRGYGHGVTPDMVSYASSASSTSISSRRSSKSSMALLMTQNNELKMRDENNNKRISDLENKQNQLFAWFFQRFQPQPPYSPGTQQSGHSQPPQQSGQSQPSPAYPYAGNNQQPLYPQPPYQVPVYRPEMAAPSGSFPEVPVGGFSGMLAGVGFDVDLSRIFGSDGGSQEGGSQGGVSQGEDSQAEGSGRRSGADSVG